MSCELNNFSLVTGTINCKVLLHRITKMCYSVQYGQGKTPESCDKRGGGGVFLSSDMKKKSECLQNFVLLHIFNFFYRDSLTLFIFSLVLNKGSVLQGSFKHTVFLLESNISNPQILFAKLCLDMDWIVHIYWYQN